MSTPYIMIKKEVDVTEIRYIHSIWHILHNLIQCNAKHPSVALYLLRCICDFITFSLNIVRISRESTSR